MSPSRREQLIGQVFTTAHRQIESNPQLRTQRRRGLRARLDRSRAQTDGLGADTLSAMARLQAGVHASQQATEARLHELAGQLGMSARETRAEFLRLRAAAPSGRQARATRDQLTDLGLIPSDPATRHALADLSTRDPLRPPVRLVQRWIPVRNTTSSAAGARLDSGNAEGSGDGGGSGEPAGDVVVEVGYSDLSNRVELRRRSGQVEAYTIPPAERDSFESVHITQRPTPETVDGIRLLGVQLGRVDQTGFAVRCDECGRFIGDRPHTCPARDATLISTPTTCHTSPGGGMLQVPAAAEISVASADNDGEPVSVPVVYIPSDPSAAVTGSVWVRPGEHVITDPARRGRQLLDIDDSEPGDLWCAGCADGSCPHVNQARQQLREHLASLGQISSPAEQRSAGLDALADVQVTDRPGRPDGSASTAPAAVSFLAEPEAFREAIRAAGAERDVPFRSDNALDGYAAGSRFGIELEFNADDYTARRRIEQQLTAAGITDGSGQHHYHHMQSRRGYTGAHWVLESDSTVPYGGELVTTIESDHRDSWDRLAAACQIIRDNGGTTDGAGSHTNISADGFTPVHARRLIRMFRAFEDDLARCGRTPGSRRDRRWAASFPDPGVEWDGQSPHWLMARYQMVNFNHAFHGSSPRLEFRFPDASHHPGVIQAQVHLAAALTGYVRDHDVPDGLENRPIGTARREGWPNQLMGSTPSQWADRTRHIRTMIDILFTRAEDRTQMAVLWARGRYQLR